jgi:hypothetical protein
MHYEIVSKSKKFVPQPPWIRQRGRSFSLYSFLTWTLDGMSDQRRPCFSPGKAPPVPIGLEAGWAPEPVWTQRLEEQFFASAGDRTPFVQALVRHFTD